MLPPKNKKKRIKYHPIMKRHFSLCSLKKLFIVFLSRPRLRNIIKDHGKKSRTRVNRYTKIFSIIYNFAPENLSPTWSAKNSFIAASPYLEITATNQNKATKAEISIIFRWMSSRSLTPWLFRRKQKTKEKITGNIPRVPLVATAKAAPK